MIKVTFDPEKLVGSKRQKWQALIGKAQLATQKVIEQWEEWLIEYEKYLTSAGAKPPIFKPTFDDKVWKALRDWLVVNVFNNKCAYCETRIIGFVSDTEHFRPKGRVSNKNKGVVKITHFSGCEINHPGYFWLAYNWKNLLPSCQICNRNGKRDYFPVGKQNVSVVKLTMQQINQLRSQPNKHSSKADIYFLEPEDLDDFEEIQLLHPYYDRPNEHLIFGVDGKAIAFDNSIKGKNSIDVYKLNEKNLLDARRDEQRKAFKEYLNAIGQEDELNEMKKAGRKALDKYNRGKYPYAAAVIDYISARLGGSDVDPKKL